MDRLDGRSLRQGDIDDAGRLPTASSFSFSAPLGAGARAGWACGLVCARLGMLPGQGFSYLYRCSYREYWTWDYGVVWGCGVLVRLRGWKGD